MKNIAIIAVVLALGWLLYAKLMRKPEVQAVTSAISDIKKGDTAPVRYVESLQRDVHKADATAQKASQVNTQNAKDIDDSLKEAGQ